MAQKRELSKVAKAKKPKPISEELKLEIAERMKRRELLTPEKRKELDHALIDAAEKGKNEDIGRLLRAGANIEAEGDDSDTALIYAANNGYAETCGFLIEKGADINAKDNKDKTALMWAAHRGETETCRLLLDRLAKNEGDIRKYVEAKDDDGWTALLYSTDNGYTETASLLKVYSDFMSLLSKDYKKFREKFDACIKGGV